MKKPKIQTHARSILKKPHSQKFAEVINVIDPYYIKFFWSLWKQHKSH